MATPTAEEAVKIVCARLSDNDWDEVADYITEYALGRLRRFGKEDIRGETAVDFAYHAIEAFLYCDWNWNNAPADLGTMPKHKLKGYVISFMIVSIRRDMWAKGTRKFGTTPKLLEGDDVDPDITRAIAELASMQVPVERRAAIRLLQAFFIDDPLAQDLIAIIIEENATTPTDMRVAYNERHPDSPLDEDNREIYNALKRMRRKLRN